MSKKSMTRRKFLQGTSALIALPVFESLWPSVAEAQAAAGTRFVFLTFPNGVYHNYYTPSGSGANFTLPEGLRVLEPHKQLLTILSNVKNTPTDNGPDGPGSHARGVACYLTNLRLLKSLQTIRASKSLDRELAERFGIATVPKWLPIAPPGQGGPDNGYSAVYSSNLSWVSATTPASRITDTREAFRLLFNGAGTVPVTDFTNKNRKSILDNAVSEANSLKNTLSSSDKQKLDQYLTAVREVEASISQAAQTNPATCAPPAAPGNQQGNYMLFTRTMLELCILGLSCDRTRVVSYLMDYEAGNRGGIDGIKEGHHSVSHHATNSNYPNLYKQILRWYAKEFEYFINRLKNIQSTGGRTLLDNSIVTFGSHFHDGNSHSNVNVPIIIAGRASGGLQSGRYVTTACRMSEVWLTLVNKAGVQMSSWGDSQKIVAGL